MVTSPVIVGCDTEGSVARPWSVQVSLTAGTGYTIRSGDTASLDILAAWLRENRERAILSLHYSLHDLPVLKALGVDVIGDGIPFVDTMLLAYALSIESQGLKALAYRHAGMHQPSYDEVIGDVGTEIALTYLLRVQSAEDAPRVTIDPPPPKLPKRRKKDTDETHAARVQAVLDAQPPVTIIHQWPTPEPEIVFEGNGAKITKPQGVQKLVDRIIADVMSGKTLKDGSLVDPRERWKKLNEKAKAPVIAAIGDMPVPTLDDIPLDRAVTYAGRDADCQLRITAPLLDRVKAMELEQVVELDHAVIPCIARMQEVGIQLAPVTFWDSIETDCRAQMDAAKYKIWQATGREVNPASGDQVAELLYGNVDEGGLGLTPPMMTDGGESGEQRGSTNDKCLENLLAVTPVAEYIMDYREADKVRGTYVEPLRRLAQIGDGRVHTTLKITRVATGRFAAENPNLLAIPIRSKLGQRCRDGFVAPEGKILYDSDLGQIEMRTFAHLSRDEKLCQVIWDGKDIHTMTASEMFSRPEDQVEKFQRQAAKQCGFGIINGITAKGLVNQMILYRATRADGSRWTEDDCEMMIREWFKIYAGARRFQLACIAETQATGLARDPLSGRIRYLPQIWSPNKTVREEAERCSYSHLIQTSANTILKRAMKVMWDALRYLEGVDMLLPVHDEVLVELPDEEDVKELVGLTVQDAFCNTTKLRVPIIAEGGFGPTWGAAH